MPVEAPDLNTYLCLQAEALSKIAGVLGEKADADLYARQADQFAQRMLDSMWDEEAGLFWASHLGQRVNVRTPFNLFPLMTGRLPAEVVTRLVAHLTNEKEFWTRYPVPTVAKDDPKYDPMVMWRGPTWLNVNYLLIEGLERTGQTDLARTLRQRSLEMMMNGLDLFEYYHPETGECPPKAASVFGWSSALFIEMAIKETELLQTSSSQA
jgi:glycogen debranching enzyme